MSNTSKLQKNIGVSLDVVTKNESERTRGKLSEIEVADAVEVSLAQLAL